MPEAAPLPLILSLSKDRHRSYLNRNLCGLGLLLYNPSAPARRRHKTTLGVPM